MRNNFPKRPGPINLIGVTFLPEGVAMVMRDDAGRKYVWCRQDSRFVQDRDNCLAMLAYIDTLDLGVTVALTNSSRPASHQCEPSHARLLARYIKRGVASEEIPMVIGAYGFLKQVDDPDSGLTDLVAETVYADLVA